MKYLKSVFSVTIHTFAVLTLLIALLSKIDLITDLPFSNTVFTLLAMSFGCGIVITIKDALLGDKLLLGFILGNLGCTLTVILIGYLAGWMKLSVDSFVSVLCISVIVYLCVWGINVFQGKKDADELNKAIDKLNHEKKD